MLLYLVRHGQTALNQTNTIQGQSLDPHLSSKGLAQAHTLASHLTLVPFTSAYTSPLHRALETAEVILDAQGKGRDDKRIKVKIDDRLITRGMGIAEGREWEEVEHELGSGEFGVEGDEAVRRRLSGWLGSLLKLHTPVASSAATPAGARTPGTPSFGFTRAKNGEAVNPFELMKALPRPGVSRTPTTAAGGGLGSGVVLCVTHQECLTALITLLMPSSSPPASPHSSTGKVNIKRPLIDVQIPESVKLRENVGNTGVAILRVWWEEGEDAELQPRGRLEAWGMDEHLEIED
ncbi:hypothetical protein L198_02564 [Cryptococcus wingfieldii CBS 7118]|uniref:Phosphoglycerate mutase n=1 Tax=Cryptococcus wingfieldii CBS 7118 TaxID=1295528 RepID=A0A1E3JNX9_9TREE|nr:hypothetical protein L198_02564 [Cryptococcus wingfieldii CBS 7118]ODO01837.1 hypothetical protein L198_02564 [Cryptococcus wingfieldii CBS 7118]